MIDEILAELRQKMNKSVESLQKDFKRIRTGRASSALLEGIKVDCYETQMPLDQVASISIPESRLITIQPWDKSIMPSIEKAILKSELGLTPLNDGKLIRISIPADRGKTKRTGQTGAQDVGREQDCDPQSTARGQ